MLFLAKFICLDDDTPKQISFFLVAVTFPCSAAFLAWRLASKRNIQSSIRRLLLVILIEICLIALLFGIPLLTVYVFKW
jgi:hypothetical protein